MRRTLSVLTLGLVLSMAALAACSSEDPTATPTAVPPTATPDSTTDTGADSGAAVDDSMAMEPMTGGVFTWTTTNDNQSGWDPHGVTRIRSLAAQALSTWTNSLVKYKHGPDVPGWETEVVPDLAESWEISADGLTYTFTLRQGVNFHNKPATNGREMTAEDVKYSADRILANEGHNFGWYFDPLESVEVVSPYVVAFHLSEPDGSFLTHLAEGMMNILPMGVAGAPTVDTWPLEDEFQGPDQIIGTGPFMFESHLLDSKLTAVRNPDYFREGLPYLDGWEYIVASDSAAQVAALASGQADGGALPAGTQDSFIDNNPDVQVWHEVPIQTMPTMQLRADTPPFNDINVRRAIMMSIDQQAIIDTRWSGSEASQTYGSIAQNAFPDLFADASALGDAAQWWEYNPTRAQELLAEAGYPEGFEIEFRASDCCTRDYFPELVVDFWTKIGLNATADIVPHAVHIRTSNRGDYKHAAHSRVSIADFQDVLRSFEPGSVANVAHVDDPELNRLAQEMKLATDPARRREIALETQRHLAAQAYVLRIPIGNPVTAVRANVHDFRPHKGFHSFGRDLEITWMSP